MRVVLTSYFSLANEDVEKKYKACMMVVYRSGTYSHLRLAEDDCSLATQCINNDLKRREENYETPGN